MKFLSTLLLLGGYMLVYAAVARGGRFATEPWEGLFKDAYDTPASAPPPKKQQPSTQQQPRPQFGIRGGLSPRTP